MVGCTGYCGMLKKETNIFDLQIPEVNHSWLDKSSDWIILDLACSSATSG